MRVLSGGVRVLGAEAFDEVWSLLAEDPVTNVFVASRVQQAGLDRLRLGGELWGVPEAGPLRSLCLVGANVVPVRCDLHAASVIAEAMLRQRRRSASLVGPQEAVLALWQALEPAWGPARDVRPVQPVMVIDGPPAVPADRSVRPVTERDLEAFFPACVAMFTEEVGVSPLEGGMGAQYRTRVTELVRAGRCWASFDSHGVVFKAEIGSVSSQACQVQGVWVRPELRGRGLAAPGMAAVVRDAMAEHAPVVTLYVNDYNVAARASYTRVGFREVDVFASVLL